MMSFSTADGWLFLVGLDVTIRIRGDVRSTGHTCEAFGNGWISDGDARHVLAEVLGEGFSGQRTTPADLAIDRPATTALGIKDPFQPAQVNFLIESWKGYGAIAPITAMSVSTAPKEPSE